MKHAIYALLALCLVLSGCSKQNAEPTKDDRLIITIPISPTSPAVRKIQVAYSNLGEMHWDNAYQSCDSLGDGWRLPTKEELQAIYRELYLKGKGNLALNWYWSGTEDGADKAWSVYFADGYAYSYYKFNNGQVRAVRDL